MFIFVGGGVTQKVREVPNQEASQCINCRSLVDLVDTNKVLKLFLVSVWRWPAKEQFIHCMNRGLFYPPSFSPLSSEFRLSESRRCQLCDREVDSDFKFCAFCCSAL